MSDWIFFGGNGEVELTEYLTIRCELDALSLRAEQKRLRVCANLHVRWLEDELTNQPETKP